MTYNDKGKHAQHSEGEKVSGRKAAHTEVKKGPMPPGKQGECQVPTGQRKLATIWGRKGKKGGVRESTKSTR